MEVVAKLSPANSDYGRNSTPSSARLAASQPRVGSEVEFVGVYIKSESRSTRQPSARPPLPPSSHQYIDLTLSDDEPPAKPDAPSPKASESSLSQAPTSESSRVDLLQIAVPGSSRLVTTVSRTISQEAPPTSRSSSKKVDSANTGAEMVSNAVEKYNDQHRTLQDAFRGQIGPIKSLLHKYLKEMKEEHVYVVKSVLAAARLEMNQQPVFRGMDGQGIPGVKYDNVSPFRNMRSIALDISVTEATQRTDIGRFSTKPHVRSNTTTPEQKLFVPITVGKTPDNIAAVPKYHSFTTLRNNILAEDDEVMHYHPYFGEEAADNDVQQLHLDETFVDRTKIAEIEGKKNECESINYYQYPAVLRPTDATMYSNFIEKFLEECDVSVAAVTRYLTGDISRMNGSGSRARLEKARRAALPADFDLENPKWILFNQNREKISDQELERCEAVCAAFKEVTDISIWEVVKIKNPKVKDFISPIRLTTGNGSQPSSSQSSGAREAEIPLTESSRGNIINYSLESYASLNCLICFMYATLTCPYSIC